MLGRDIVLFLGYVVLMCGALATVLKLALFFMAAFDWADTRSLPADHPDRIVAVDELWEDLGRVLSTTVILVVGIAWVLTLTTTTEETIRFTTVSLVIVFSYVVMAFLAVVQGIRAMLTRRRLLRLFRDRRAREADLRDRLERVAVRTDHG